MSLCKRTYPGTPFCPIMGVLPLLLFRVIKRDHIWQISPPRSDLCREKKTQHLMSHRHCTESLCVVQRSHYLLRTGKARAISTPYKKLCHKTNAAQPTRSPADHSSSNHIFHNRVNRKFCWYEREKCTSSDFSLASAERLFASDDLGIARYAFPVWTMRTWLLSVQVEISITQYICGIRQVVLNRSEP